MGTGVVAFNLAPKRALLCDTNPHLISFYQALSDQDVTPESVKSYLEKEGGALLEKGESHYYEVRARFNKEHQPLDFLFLNRAGFNGMIRFNRKGEFNIPFCRKPARFAQAYITKITNQVGYVSQLLKAKSFTFKCQEFEKTVSEGCTEDMIYCDPPYINRHADYYNGWELEHEVALFKSLCHAPSKFILSTWHHNHYRENQHFQALWSKFNIVTKTHFYHVGASENNRHPVVEALIANYTIPNPNQEHHESTKNHPHC